MIRTNKQPNEVLLTRSLVMFGYLHRIEDNPLCYQNLMKTKLICLCEFFFSFFYEMWKNHCLRTCKRVDLLF